MCELYVSLARYHDRAVICPLLGRFILVPELLGRTGFSEYLEELFQQMRKRKGPEATTYLVILLVGLSRPAYIRTLILRCLIFSLTVCLWYYVKIYLRTLYLVLVLYSARPSSRQGPLIVFTRIYALLLPLPRGLNMLMILIHTLCRSMFVKLHRCEYRSLIRCVFITATFYVADHKV